MLQLRRMALEHFHREDHIVGIEGFAVAPLDPIAQLQGPPVEVGIGEAAFAQPGLQVTGFVVENEQRFEHGLVKTVVAPLARYERIPQLGIHHAPAVDVKDDSAAPFGKPFQIGSRFTKAHAQSRDSHKDERQQYDKYLSHEVDLMILARL